MADTSIKREKNQETDQELVIRTLADKQAFSLLVRRYDAPLFRYILRMGWKDNSSAQDLLQEIFIKAYIHLNDYDPSLSFSSWIYRIAHNEIVSSYRKEKTRPNVLKKETDFFIFDNIADDAGLSTHEGKRFNAAEIQDAVNGLEPKYRDIIVLKFFEEKSYDEISDILQMPLGTVATLINRAKKKIRELLERRH
ncbi:MAG: sigma-70 family RNA polymerase sigma factor [Chlorobium sp.]|nr:MAG: sigma-70 family RNA polymerase sigma factor [Chlorobium sp.]